MSHAQVLGRIARLGSAPSTPSGARLWHADFTRFWIGQTVSASGTAVTQFILPLLVYWATHSALSLSVATAVTFLPYLLFGLVIGAVVDRVDRRKLMIGIDVVRACTIALLPLAYHLATFNVLSIYVVVFVNSTLALAYNAARFAAIPLICRDPDLLVPANSCIQAGASAASILGPLIAGALLLAVSPPSLLLIDAASFAVSAVCLIMLTTRLSLAAGTPGTTLLGDARAGISYVWRHPLLRALALMAAATNIFFVNIFAQLVLFASTRLGASGTRIGLLYSGASAGIIVFSLLAPACRRRFPFAVLVLGSLFLLGAGIVLLSYVTSYLLGILLWSVTIGLTNLFAINTTSLRQAAVPNALLGRVASVSQFIAWSVEPPAALLGGVWIDATHNVAAGYRLCGLAMAAVAAVSLLSPITRAGQYSSTIRSEVPSR